ncbi:hypothetical protein BDZ90DRAFT_231838 [Jaminaea rosea]|uniref:CAP-Gly domain-containing protein n=1 Tax=Jaminaea rosea TaxID=1569628 RepID=A0A316US11_9BASI|nr:hypothetical protein BDZ90DRAFT_231838 [Jaminaea rosea]PWN28076.1 hypothetical protein BDZ90DRAFT_231838 [Jaminaea rosea]
MSQPIRLHSRVVVVKVGLGTVLFVGQTSFAPGLWVGVVLDPDVVGGKNDGSVQGKRYFDADPGQGIFVRSSQIEVLEDEPEEEYNSGDDILMDDEPMMQTPRTTTMRMPPPASTSRSSSSLSQTTVPRAGLRAPASRTTSPDKPSAGAPRTVPRPSLASRTSAVSSTSATSSAASSRRPSATPSTSGRISAASPSKPASLATPARPGMSRAGTSVSATSGRVSASSSSAASTRPPSSAAALSRTASPSKATARGVRPASGITGALTSARPTAEDAQSTAARTGLRPVAKARPSMAAPSASAATPKRTIPRPGAAITGPSKPAAPAAATITTPRRLSTAGSHKDQQEDSSSDPNVTSPSADARQRLDAARSRVEAARKQHTQPQTTSARDRPSQETSDPISFAGDEDGDDLVNMSLEGGQEEALNPAHVVRSPPISQGPPGMSNVEAQALKREVEELRVRNRLNEKRREEERARVKELEKWKEEVTEKLRSADTATEKAQSLSTQLLAIQTTEKELSMEKSDLEARVEDLTEQLEMAALDREVAEEKAEAAITELDSLKQIQEELTLEVEVLREENAAYEHGPVDEEERSSVGWLQMEKQNERLKEALIRLRDVTSESDHDQKRKISDLEKELSALADLQDSRDSLAAKLEASEAQLEDVKVQLDDALGAEEMLEQLTERNLFLGERLNEMAATIEELESLKELNEELDEVHVETEKQLQEEVDLKDMALRERDARVEALETNANEYEATFAQFRELVLNLQSDVEALRAERDGLVEEGQNANLNSQSREMLNLNLKLQSSALKSQARTIEAELARMRADQASTQLEMTQPYLPQAFAQEGDRDAVASLLFFKRMSTKAELIKSVVENTHEISQAIGSLAQDDSGADQQQQHLSASTSTTTGGTSSTRSEHLVNICQLRHSLAHFSAVCSSVVAMLRLAPPGTFLRCGRTFKEMQAVVEPRVDAFVEALRKEELKEADCGAEFKRFVRQFEEMSFALMMAQEEEIGQLVQQQQQQLQDGTMPATPPQSLPSGEGDLAAKEVGSATLLDLDLDTLCASLSSARHTVLQAQAAEGAIEWQLQGETMEQRYFVPLHQIVNDVRAAKVLARKLLRRLSSLADNDEAVSMDAIGELPLLGRLSSRLVAFATTLSSGMTAYVDEVRNASSPFTLQGFTEVVRQATGELRLDDGSAPYTSPTTTVDDAASSPASSDLWREALSATSHLTTTIQALMASAVDQSHVIKLSGPHPWHPRSHQIHLLAKHDPAMESQMAKLGEDLRDLYQQIKARDAALAEGQIKMERLHRQVAKSKGEGDALEEVKAGLGEARREAKAYQDANESLQAELEALEKANEELKSKAAASIAATGAAGSAGQVAAEAGSGVTPTSSTLATSGALAGLQPAANLDTHHLIDQLDATRCSLRYLREENALLRSKGYQAQLDSLAPLPTLRVRPRDDETGKVDEQEAAGGAGLPRKARPDAPRDEELRSVRSEARSLYGALLHFAATPRLVKLADGGANSSADVKAEGDGDEKSEIPTAAVSAARQRPRATVGWQRQADQPAWQYEAQKAVAAELGLRFEKLMERRSGAGVSKSPAGSRQAMTLPKMPRLAVVVGGEGR